jgi:hypothetical protein
MESVEKSANSTFCYVISNRYIGVRLDFYCVCFGVATAIFCLCLKNSTPTALLTFSLQIITDVIVFFSISIRMYAEV